MWLGTMEGHLINTEKLDEIRIEDFRNTYFVVAYGEFNPAKNDYERYVLKKSCDEKDAKNYLENLGKKVNGVDKIDG